MSYQELKDHLTQIIHGYRTDKALVIKGPEASGKSTVLRFLPRDGLYLASAHNGVGIKSEDFSALTRVGIFVLDECKKVAESTLQIASSNELTLDDNGTPVYREANMIILYSGSSTVLRKDERVILCTPLQAINTILDIRNDR